jgi:hypothetical protein
MDKKHATLRDDRRVITHAPSVVSEKGILSPGQSATGSYAEISRTLPEISR